MLSIAPGSGAALTSEALFRFADARSRTSDVADGVRAMYEAAWAAEALHDDDTAARAWSELTRSVGLVQGRFEEADLILHQAQAAVERAGGGDDLVCSLMGGTLLWKEGKLEEALAQEKRTAEACRRAFGPDHFSNAAEQGNIGSEESLLGRYEEALADETAAELALERALGPEHPIISLALDNVAATLEELGHPQEAIALARRALAISERSVGHDHPNRAMSLLVLGKALRETPQGAQRKEARADFDEALALQEHVSKDSLGVASALQERGIPSVEEERWKDAEADLRRAVALESGVEPDHYDLVLALIALRQVERATGRTAQALEEHRRAVAIATKSLGKSHPVYGKALVALGETLLETANAGATAALGEAIAVLEAHPVDPAALAAARAAMARATAHVRR